jgi:hypothetical protein
MQKPFVLMLFPVFGEHLGFAKNQSHTLIWREMCDEIAIRVSKSA